MNTDTTTRTAADITNGTWIVRFDGVRKPNGTLARQSWGKVSDRGLTRDSCIYDMPVAVSEANSTTLESAEKIIGIAGFSDVLPIKAWETADGGKTFTDTFIFPQFS